MLVLELESGGRKWRHEWPIDDRNRSMEPWMVPDLEGHVQVRVCQEAYGIFALDLRADEAWTQDVTARFAVPLDSRREASHILWPTYHGVFERYAAGNSRSGEFRGAGGSAVQLDSRHRLALPMAVLETAGYAAVGADPTFTTAITLQRCPDGHQQIVFAWKWLAQAGIHESEQRRFFVRDVRDLRDALDVWFLTATPDIPPGPRWLHDIAVTDYDFLSKNGRGWYADIDAACALIAPEERHRMIFCLHGWYDEVGSYCIDPESGEFLETWTAFPYINHPEVVALSTKEPHVQDIPGLYAYAFRNLEHYHPVPMSWADIRHRLQYAKERGFRTAFYAMTGLQTAGSKDAHLADGGALDLEFPLWVGPELLGQSYIRNPLKREVRDFYKRYIAMLLERIGDLTDALVMDEAYYIPYGCLGPEACPGYADRAQLTLVKELAEICHRYRSDLAFLTADNLGLSRLEKRAFPYNLYADGIFTDVMCWPMSWDCFRFPAWRNTAWSCNWAPYSNLNFTRWGVIAHQGNVSLSNGCFGDDMGLSDMDELMLAEIRELWTIRKSRIREKEISVINVYE